MAEKPPEEVYVSVVDEEPEIFELLKWDSSHTQKPQEPRPVEKVPTPEKRSSKPQDCYPFDLDDTVFIDTYRLSKNLVRNLCEELKPVMPDSTKFVEFSIENKVLATLSFYATGKYQRTAKMDSSINQYFATTAVKQVTEALNDPAIVKKYIHFPHLRNERDVIKTRFYMKYGIPNVVGCVDCTHVPIARPEDDQKLHHNKSYHSKKVQIICDSDCNILSVDSTAGGAMSHDAILQRHAVKNDLDSLNRSGENCWLIGGPHYTQKIYLMVPIPKITKKSPVSPEKYYSTMHSQAHSAVLETIKQLKSRWKCLQATCNKQLDPPSVAQLIVACCVLHNICGQYCVPAVQMAPAEERLEAMKQKVANGPVPRKQIEDHDGMQIRTRLVERLWNERRVAPESGTKKRKKNATVECPQPPPQPAPPHHHHHAPPHYQHLHDEANKRPRVISMGYGLNVQPGWEHYPQH